MPKKTLATRVTDLEKRLFELWRHEGHLSGMVLRHLGEGVAKNPRDRIIDAIEAEREFQDKKWGPLKFQNDGDPEMWIRAIHEELIEAEQERKESMLDAFSPNFRIEFFLEMVQVAATAVACLEQLAPEDIAVLAREHRAQEMKSGEKPSQG